MPSERVPYLRSSIFRKQIVAGSGLIMVGFVIGHLAGNMLLLAGPERFNAYAEFLQSLGELLWLVRAVMIAAVLAHVVFTLLLTLENMQARGQGYVVNATLGNTNFVRKTMIYSGALVFFFLFIHLADFTFGDKTGAPSIIAGLNGDKSLGLFGLVWRSFLFTEHWWRPVFYVLAVICVGAHLTHGIQSMFQTIGFNHDRYTPWIQRGSVVLGVLVGAGFSLIPLYVNIIGTPSL